MVGCKRVGVHALLVLVGLLGIEPSASVVAPANAQGQVPPGRPIAKLQRMRVPLNNSHTIRLDFPFTDVLVGSSEIADVIPLSDQTLYVLGKKPGTTNVSVLDAQKKVLAVVDVQVSVDAGVIDQNARASGLSIRGQGDHVVVSGIAPDAPTVDRAVQAAGTLVPPERIINNSTIASPQQVMLKVRFIEVDREAGRELGIRSNYLGQTRTARVGGRQVVADQEGNGSIVSNLISSN